MNTGSDLAHDVVQDLRKKNSEKRSIRVYSLNIFQSLINSFDVFLPQYLVGLKLAKQVSLSGFMTELNQSTRPTTVRLTSTNLRQMNTPLLRIPVFFQVAL